MNIDSSGFSLFFLKRLKCMICELILRDPHSLSCGHVFCKRCIDLLVVPAAPPQRCPQCHQELLAAEPSPGQPAGALQSPPANTLLSLLIATIRENMPALSHGDRSLPLSASPYASPVIDPSALDAVSLNSSPLLSSSASSPLITSSSPLITSSSPLLTHSSSSSSSSSSPLRSSPANTNLMHPPPSSSSPLRDLGSPSLDVAAIESGGVKEGGKEGDIGKEGGAGLHAQLVSLKEKVGARLGKLIRCGQCGQPCESYCEDAECQALFCAACRPHPAAHQHRVVPLAQVTSTLPSEWTFHRPCGHRSEKETEAMHIHLSNQLSQASAQLTSKLRALSSVHHRHAPYISNTAISGTLSHPHPLSQQQLQHQQQLQLQHQQQVQQQQQSLPHIPGPNLIGCIGGAERERHGFYSNWFPWGLALDASRNVLVCDYTKHQIRFYSNDGGLLMTFGSRGQGAGQFCRPLGIAVNREGNLLVVDSDNHRICMLSAGGSFLSTLGGAGSGDVQFHHPRAVIVNQSDGTFLVADTGNHRILKFNHLRELVLSFGNRGAALGRFAFPFAAAISPTTANIFVSDHANHRVQVFDPTGLPLFAFGTFGKMPGQFAQPCGLAINKESRIFVCDYLNNRCQYFTEDGVFLGWFKVPHPKDIVIDINGHIMISTPHGIQVFQ